MGKYALAAIFLLSFYYGFSQNPSFQLAFKHLTPDDGLSQGTNAYVYKDSRGFIWIGSLDGLNRFDGIKVKIYRPNPQDSTSLFGRNITSQFFEDNQGNIWFTTNEAINCYQRATDNFRRFQVSDSLGQLIKKDYYAFHLDKNQQLWVRTGLGKEGRLHLFDLKLKKDELKFPLDGHRCSVVLDEEGVVQKIIASMFFTRPGFEIMDCQEKGKKVAFTLAELSKKLGFTVFTRNVFVENESTLWIGSMAGLIEFDLKKEAIREVFHYLPYADFEGTHWSVIPFRADYLLVGTLDKGILIFDKKERKFIQQIQKEADNKNSINKNRVRELYLDEDENLWVSRYEGGVAYANFNKVKFPVLDETKNKKTYSIFEHEEEKTVWLGLKKEIKIISHKHKEIEQLKTYVIKAANGEETRISPIVEPVESIVEDKNNVIWVIFGQKIARFDPLTRQLILEKRLKEKSSAHPLKGGEILLLSNDGIHCFDPSKPFNSTPFFALQGYENGYYTHVFEGKNERLYLAENATNLKIFEKKLGNYHLTKDIENIGYCFHFFENVREQKLYVTTSSGLLQINLKTLEYQLLNEQNDGLPNEVFYSAFEDEKGDIWLSTNHGIIRYNPRKKRYHRFTVADGLQGNEFLPGITLKTASGEIWMGGGKGLNFFRPEQIRAAIKLPSIQLIQLFINDEPATIPVQIGELTELKLPYTQNTLSFDFAALEYSDAPNNQFKYQLLGNGFNTPEEWIENKNRGFVRFANLPPGAYEFNIKASNSDGFWKEDYKSLALVITPPFWMTWWFYLLCIFIIVAMVYAIFQFRLEQALKVERLRVKISSDLHDDVGGLLSGLAMKTEVLELTAEETVKPKLRQIAEISRHAMSRMRDTVWAIDARKDKMENLIDRMREHIEEVIAPKNMSYDLELHQVNLKTNLPTDVRQNIYLIFKEAITNIAKHSKGDRVLIALKNEADFFEMTIHDNGTSTEKAYKTTGLGLSNMELRASQIKGQLQVKRSNGFKVIFRMKRI